MDQGVKCPFCRNTISSNNFQTHEPRCKKIWHEENPNQEFLQNIQPFFSELNNRNPLELDENNSYSCPNCGKRVLFSNIVDHENNCQHRLDRCEFCDSQFPQDLMQPHQDQCEARKIIEREMKKYQQLIQAQEEQEQIMQQELQREQQLVNEQRQRDSQRQQQQPQRQQQQEAFNPLDIFSLLSMLGNQGQQQQSQERVFRGNNSNQVSRVRVNNDSVVVEVNNNGRVSRRNFNNQDDPDRGLQESNVINQIPLNHPFLQQRRIGGVNLMQLISFLGSQDLINRDPSNNGGLSQEQQNNFESHIYKKYKKEESKSTIDKEDSCTICMSDFENGEKVKYLACMHLYHDSCIDEWLKKNSTCPVCKKDMKQHMN